MANSLRADPIVRDRYQFWFVYYPTGAPLMASAVRVRQALHDLRDAIDPARTDAALDQMVVVGHSLGGVLSKQLVQDSGDTLEPRGLFTRPQAEVAMTPESRNKISRLLYFKPEPSIRRARVHRRLAASGKQRGQPIHRPSWLDAHPATRRHQRFARRDHRDERDRRAPTRVPP